jgi:hypothetical protein
VFLSLLLVLFFPVSLVEVTHAIDSYSALMSGMALCTLFPFSDCYFHFVCDLTLNNLLVEDPCVFLLGDYSHIHLR